MSDSYWFKQMLYQAIRLCHPSTQVRKMYRLKIATMMFTHFSASSQSMLQLWQHTYWKVRRASLSFELARAPLRLGGLVRSGRKLADGLTANPRVLVRASIRNGPTQARKKPLPVRGQGPRTNKNKNGSGACPLAFETLVLPAFRRRRRSSQSV